MCINPALFRRLFRVYDAQAVRELNLVPRAHRTRTQFVVAHMAEGCTVSVVLLVLLCSALSALPFAKSRSVQIPDEDWNYVQVRENAFMFWWLYGAYTSDRSERVDKPLIMWLQGGPGGSSTGFGNFEELGPLTVELKPRNTTWLQAANVLFVDNPVGSGYSYVTDKNAFTTNVTGELPCNYYMCKIIIVLFGLIDYFC